jgi:AcrR family transcriptional regulator
MNLNQPESAALTRPMRADARRNYENVLAAAREAFADRGTSTSLEEIARRAGVGIGTLYRHFPTRAALLEAVYIGELRDLCASTESLGALEPWEAFDAWMHRLVGYLVTKQALAAEMIDHLGPGASVFQHSRATLFAAAGPLVDRAHAAGVLRSDTNLPEIVQMAGGIAKIQATEPGQIEHILTIALDGLRGRGPS